MAGAERVEEIRKDVEERGIEFFFAQFVDLYARPSAKLIPAAYLDDLVNDGAGFAGFAAGDIGQLPSDPDIAAMPDLDSFTPVPWDSTVARFACDITVEGEPWPYDPRTILRNQLARAREAGYDFRIGLELEYFLVRRTEDGGIDARRPARRPREAVLRPARPHAELRLPHDRLALRATSSAGGTTRTTTRTRTASSSRTSRTPTRSSRATARSSSATWCTRSRSSRGLLATFMPKPFTHLTGNGCHFHMSLWRDERERVPRRGRPARARPLGDRVPLHRRA